MRAPDILAATHNLEEAGMDRSQSEAAARTEFKSDMAAIRSELKAGMAANRTEFKGEIRRLETKMDVAVEHLATKKEVESVKVWLICGLLPIALGIVALMYQINA